MLVAESHFTIKSYLKIPDYAIYDSKNPDCTVHSETTLIILILIKKHD